MFGKCAPISGFFSENDVAIWGKITIKTLVENQMVILPLS